jgi:hypothetical protein
MGRLPHTIILFLALGCSSKEPAPVPVVSDYLPLKRGVFQIYSVDSIVVKQNAETAYNFELKTLVTDSFPNAEGGYTYVIQRFKRVMSSSPWTALGSWSARANAFQAVVNEGNISYVKIEGPLVNGKAWNGNAFNILGGTEKCLDRDSHTCDIYWIASFAKPYTPSSGRTFDNTVTIVQNDNKDLIVAQDKRSEVYAWRTGLVYREINSLKYCTDPGCVGTQFVTTGLKYKQRISDYGTL